MDKKEVDSSINETNQCKVGMMNENNNVQMSEAAQPPVQMASVQQPQLLQEKDGGVVAPPCVHQVAIGDSQAPAPVAEAAEPPIADQRCQLHSQQQDGGVVAPPCVHQVAIGDSQAPAPVAEAAEPPIADQRCQLHSQQQDCGVDAPPCVHQVAIGDSQAPAPVAEAAEPPIADQRCQLHSQQQDGGVDAPPCVHQATPAAIGDNQAPEPFAEAAGLPIPDPSVLAAAMNQADRYNRNDNLIRGIRLLSRVRVGYTFEFECPSCRRLFGSSSQLIRHMKLQYPWLFT
ncbi:MAGE-like protein 2 [Nilaparvata lugens]|uniref:MAGE-like protein 2 n=1 Tax=Nilaparvata lugens TaxID=108931 RepID=UPI00193D917C|nr:MAGE-like protein 2 [Nilaparvata lugens]